jgi:hypothetical protein
MEMSKAQIFGMYILSQDKIAVAMGDSRSYEDTYPNWEPTNFSLIEDFGGSIEFGSVSSISFGDDIYLTVCNHNCDYYLLEDEPFENLGETFKLLLRTVDDLTDEEIAAVYGCGFWYREYGFSCTMARIRPEEEPTKRDFFLNSFKKALSIDGGTFSSTVDYLRSIGVDCDGLIDRGWAIRKEIKQ